MTALVPFLEDTTMQLMLVYRFLRKISDCTMAGFYSDVYVTGRENVPQDGPIILAGTHHNEIIDIAALSVTIPFRRQICFWAKSTLFKNPFAGALLSSSGSIPVHRNPNSLVGRQSGSSDSGSSVTSHSELFKHTSVALAQGKVVGVFPEGTSYTEPAIVHVKEGAAWAAVEYVKAVASRSMEEARKDLLIVPAAIVYTDKSQYQSRVIVRYGKPIRVNDFLAELNLENHDSVHAAVKIITEGIYQRLKEMTINAPDWGTYNSAKIARDVAWGEGLGLGVYVRESQSFVEIISDDSQETRRMKQSLVKYLGLLHYSGISHAALDHLYPLPRVITSSSTAAIPTVPNAFLTVFRQLLKTFLHPSAIAFLPMFILHIPMYIIGWLAAQFLSDPDEEESKAQYKAIFGGLGIGFSYGLVVRMVLKMFMHSGSDDKIAWLFQMLPLFSVSDFIAPGQQGLLRELIGTVVVTAGTVHILWKWHNFLVRDNLERWRRLSASIKILIGLISPTSNDLSEEGLVAYSRPPRPAENPFIKRRTLATVDSDTTNPPPVSATKLIRTLLATRMDAVCAVRKLQTMIKGAERNQGVEGVVNDKTYQIRYDD